MRDFDSHGTDSRRMVHVSGSDYGRPVFSFQVPLVMPIRNYSKGTMQVEALANTLCHAELT